MVEEKELSVEVADKIGQYVKKSGKGQAAAKELIKTLSDNAELINVALAREGLQEMELLVQYCEVMGVVDKVRNKPFS